MTDQSSPFMQASFGDPAITDLVKKVAQGNQKAASQLYQQYSKAMYNTLYRMTNNEDEAKDLLQESFVKAFRNLETFKGDSTFGAWLKRIVVNTGLEYLRKRKIDFLDLDHQNQDWVEDEVSTNWEEILAEVKLVRMAIQNLPTGTRNIVSLHLLEGYTHDEISEMLDISPSTSKTQYMRGKTLVKKNILGSYEKRSI